MGRSKKSLEAKAPVKQRPPASRAADAFVMLAMALVTLALGIGLYLQFRLDFWLALVAALSIYVGMLSIHSLIRRSERVDHLTAEIERLQHELSRLKDVGTRVAANRETLPMDIGPLARPVSMSGASPTLPVPSQPGRMAQPAPQASEAHRSATDKETSVRQDPFAVDAAPAELARSFGPATQDVAGAAATLRDTTPSRNASDPGALAGPPPLPTSTERGAIAPPEMDSGFDPEVGEEIAEALRGQWSFRPSAPPTLDPVPTMRPGAVASAPPPLSTSAAAHAHWPLDGIARPAQTTPQELTANPIAEPPGATLSEKDVELIGSLIRKMADEVNAADALPAHAARSNGVIPGTDAIEESLRALRSTASAMRAPAGPPASPELPFDAAPPAHLMDPPPIAGPGAGHAPVEGHADRDVRRAMPAAAAHASTRTAVTPGSGLSAVFDIPGEANTIAASPPAGSGPAMAPNARASFARDLHRDLHAVSDALAHGRIDVLLDPILGLRDQRARHYEVTLRLRGPDGTALPPIAEVSGLSGSGLLPLLDCARIYRTSAVAARLAGRGKDGAVFSGFSGESLSNDEFLNRFAEVYGERQEIAAQLVLSFEQQDVRAFSTRDIETLAEMREMGFRFALGGVTDLDMDFETLKASGFEFVKLDASVFLEGMPASGGVVPAADICRHLAGLGLALIVNEIADEATLARIFGFGVVLGQGSLFGGPRPMKAEALGAQPVAA